MEGALSQAGSQTLKNVSRVALGLFGLCLLQISSKHPSGALAAETSSDCALGESSWEPTGRQSGEGLGCMDPCLEGHQQYRGLSVLLTSRACDAGGLLLCTIISSPPRWEGVAR